MIGAVPRTSAIGLTTAAWLLGGATTAVMVTTPYLGFGYRSPSLHLVLDTVDGCVALLVAYLLYGRLRRNRAVQDLLLADGLLLLALAGLGLTLLDLSGAVRPETLDLWAPLAIRVLAALLVLAAALAGPLRSSPAVGTGARLVVPLVVAGTLLAVWSGRDLLPVALDGSPPPSAQFPVIAGHPLLLVGQAATAVMFAAASALFAARARGRDDELLRWLGPACALAALARLNYVLFPSWYSDWLYTGDLLRTGCYLLLLVGAAREIRQYWSARAEAAVLEDRRRLARELHDGVVQELAFIRATAHDLGSDSSAVVVASCDRALDEARAAVDLFGRDPDEPLGATLRRAARHVADRYDGQLEVDLDETVPADPDQRHALVRITREAVANALRHGQADRVQVRLAQNGAGRRLVVRDDGRGFDLDAVSEHGTGYGLTSMRERSQAIPGSFSVRSAPGRGTTVEVTW